MAKEKNTGMAIVAYILFFIPLLTDAKDDQFVKYHVKQGLVLFILGVALSILFRIFWFLWFLDWIVWVIYVVIAVMGIINASNSEQKPLPIIGKYADNIKL